MARIGCYQASRNDYGGLDPRLISATAGGPGEAGEWARTWESTAGRPGAGRG